MIFAPTETTLQFEIYPVFSLRGFSSFAIKHVQLHTEIYQFQSDTLIIEQIHLFTLTNGRSRTQTTTERNKNRGNVADPFITAHSIPMQASKAQSNSHEARFCFIWTMLVYEQNLIKDLLYVNEREILLLTSLWRQISWLAWWSTIILSGSLGKSTTWATLHLNVAFNITDVWTAWQYTPTYCEWGFSHNTAFLYDLSALSQKHIIQQTEDWKYTQKELVIAVMIMQRFCKWIWQFGLLLCLIDACSNPDNQTSWLPRVLRFAWN